MHQARRAHEIFRASLDVAPAQLDAFIARECGSDAALRIDVEQLIAAGGRAGAFLETPAVALGSPALRAGTLDAESQGNAPPMIGRRIGRNTILSLIASGGMGAVFLAEQDQPRRRVALKIMRSSAFSRSALRRFEYESQILANLHHPAIAQVFEAGTWDDGVGGVPFFAMEYVENAQPMTRFAQARGMTIAQRLELFLQACDAVHFGHQRGVIHRDLKPANILVSEPGIEASRRQDREEGAPSTPRCLDAVMPQLKIIDFGVARVLEGHLGIGHVTAHTEAGQLLGTVAYMSPEQFEADGSRVDVRSDVYALGVTLYELLTGRMPYDLAHSGVYEAAKIVLERAPESPARAFDGRPIPTDLQTIALKALEKSPQRRYQSAAELAADIRRFATHRPIEARRPSAAYHLRLFARRNRGLVAGLALAAALLAAGSVVSTILAVGQARARSQAELREGEANRQAAIARETLAFLNDDLLAQADPHFSSRADLTVREAAEAAERKLQEGGRFAGEPLVEAAVRLTLGRTHLSLGRSAQAEPHLAHALEVRRSLLGADDRETLDALYQLAWLRYHQRDYAAAAALLEETVRGREAVLGPEHHDTLAAMNTLASVWLRQHRYHDAERLLISVLESRRRVLGEDHPQVIESIDGVARLEAERGRFADAERLYREAFERSGRLWGPGHRFTLYAMGNLARMLIRLERFDDAAALLRDALAQARSLLGPDHPDTLVYQAALAAVHVEQRRYPEAEALLHDALQRQRAVHGEGDGNTIELTIGLAALRSKQGRSAEAQSMLEAALIDAGSALGADDPVTLSVQMNLGMTLDARGERARAEPLLREALQRHRAALGAEHPQTLSAAHALAFCLGNLGRLTEAEALFREVIDGRRRTIGEAHPATAIALSNLGYNLGQQQRWEEAAEALGASVDAWHAGPGRGRLLSASALGNLGGVLVRLNRADEAEPLLREALEVQRSALGEDDPALAITLAVLGEALLAQRRFEEAETLLLDSHARMQEADGGVPASHLQRARARLARLYEAWNKPDEAARWRDAAQ